MCRERNLMEPKAALKEPKAALKNVARRVLGRDIAIENDGAQQIVQFRGVRLLAGPTNKLEHRILEGGDYDPANLMFAESVVAPGDVCFDVGANIGIYSTLLGTWAGPSGAVHAFEPVRHIRAKLRRNLAINRLRNVTVQGIGLGEEETTLVMNQIVEGEVRAGTSTFTDNENVASLGASKFDRVEVPVKTLDGYVDENGIDRIDFLKVDIEGFELPFLKGAQKTLLRLRPVVLMEHSQKRLRHLDIDESEFKTLAEAIQYDFFELRRQDDEVILIPFQFDREIRAMNVVGFARETAD